MKENRSVSRVLQVLELIAKHEDGITLGQIYRTLGIPKATAYDVLQTLYKHDAIYYKDPNLRNYVIGSKMFAIGSVYIKNSNFLQSVRSDLKEFANQYGRTVFGTKRIDEKVVYVYKYQPVQSHINTSQLEGSVIYELENDPAGLAFLIFEDNNQTLKKKYNVENNYLEMRQEGAINISSIASPVYNFENKICGVIVAADIMIEDQEKHKEMVKEFLSVAENASRRLGFMGVYHHN